MTTHTDNDYPPWDPVGRPAPQPIQQSSYSTSFYGQHGGRQDPRHDPTAYRGYNLPTPIHDVDSDNSNGQRRRIQVACARCRRRKIKCTGDPGNGSGCQACRSSGADLSACTFDRVGTTFKYQVEDTSDAGSQQTISPTASYGSSSFSTGHGLLDVDSRQAYTLQHTAGVYDRSSYISQTPLDSYPFDIQNGSTAASAEASYSDDRLWTIRPPTSIGNFSVLSTSPSYENSLAPLNTLSLSSPPVGDRRLPAPAPKFDILTSPISSAVNGRLASLSINDPSRGTNQSVPHGRQNTIQDLVNTSVMLPPVTRDYKSNTSQSRDTGLQGYGYQPSSEDLYGCTSATTGPGYHASTTASTAYSAALPPMLAPPIDSHYNQLPLSTSAPSIPTMIIPHRPGSRQGRTLLPDTSASSMYGWATANDMQKQQSSVKEPANDVGSMRPQRYQPIAPLGSSQPKPPRRGSTQKARIEGVLHGPTPSTSSDRS